MNTKTSLLLLLSAFLLTSCVLLDCAIPAASASTPSFSGANLRIEEYLLIGEPLYESTTLNFAGNCSVLHQNCCICHCEERSLRRSNPQAVNLA